MQKTKLMGDDFELQVSNAAQSDLERNTFGIMLLGWGEVLTLVARGEAPESMEASQSFLVGGLGIDSGEDPPDEVRVQSP